MRVALGGMLQEEARTRLSRIPFALIRLASSRLPSELRCDLAAEWKAELEYLLADTDGLPVTRLLRGIRYSAGLLASAPAIADGLSGSDKRLVRRVRLVGAAVSVTIGLSGFATGISEIMSEGSHALPGIATVCTAMAYFGLACIIAGTRWTSVLYFNAPSVMGQICWYFVLGDRNHLVWAAIYFGLLMVTLTIRLISRRLIRAHNTKYPDCPQFR
jgi:hypothetical protein